MLATVVTRGGWMATPLALALGARLAVFVAADVGGRMLAPKQFGGAMLLGFFAILFTLGYPIY
jgi:hypothetical protein